MADVIAAGKQVSIHFRLTLDDGSLLEDTTESDPVSFRYGVGEMVPGLEAQLAGKRAGDECRVEVPAADAYGEYDPAAEQAVPRTQFPPGADVQPGVSFQAEGPNGVVPVRVLRIDHVGRTALVAPGLTPASDLWAREVRVDRTQQHQRDAAPTHDDDPA